MSIFLTLCCTILSLASWKRLSCQHRPCGFCFCEGPLFPPSLPKKQGGNTCTAQQARWSTDHDAISALGSVAASRKRCNTWTTVTSRISYYTLQVLCLAAKLRRWNSEMRLKLEWKLQSKFATREAKLICAFWKCYENTLVYLIVVTTCIPS